MNSRIALLLTLLLASTHVAADQERIVGTVRIFNDNDYRITVLSLSRDAFGAQVWRDKFQISAHHFVDLPKVSAGVQLGFKKTDDESVTWPPVKVYYPRPDVPIAVIRISEK